MAHFSGAAARTTAISSSDAPFPQRICSGAIPSFCAIALRKSVHSISGYVSSHAVYSVIACLTPCGMPSGLILTEKSSRTSLPYTFPPCISLCMPASCLYALLSLLPRRAGTGLPNFPALSSVRPIR